MPAAINCPCNTEGHRTLLKSSFFVFHSHFGAMEMIKDGRSALSSVLLHLPSAAASVGAVVHARFAGGQLDQLIPLLLPLLLGVNQTGLKKAKRTKLRLTFISFPVSAVLYTRPQRLPLG